MSLFDSTLVAPQSYEAVESIRDILAADTTNIVKAYWIDAAAHVFLHFIEETRPDRHLLVREVTSIGGNMQTITGHLVVRFQVMASIDMNQLNTHKWLGGIHNRIRKALVGQKPSLSLGSMALPVNRQSVPSPAALDDDTKEWYSTADFFATIEPTP